MMTVELAGQHVTLDADRALIWKDVVVIADPHFGKDATARASAIPMPHGTTAADLQRLDAVLQRHSAQELWMLGDVFDSAHARELETLEPIVAWRQRNQKLVVRMVAGNHDRMALGLAKHCGFEVLPHLAEFGPWHLSHHPANVDDGYVLCGHVHPGLQIRGSARERLKLPAFIFGKRQAILPAFGGMTGSVRFPLGRQDRGYVVAGSEVVGPLTAAA